MIQIERRHFGVLIPSTNTTVEIEYTRHLPATLQFHVGRCGKAANTPFSPSLDEDVIRQSKLLGDAKVEVITLAQTSASLFDDDYDTRVKAQMSSNAGVPAVTSAEAIGEAVRALGMKRIGIVTPYSAEVIQRAKQYLEMKYGLQVLGMEGFGATDAYAIGKLDANMAFEALQRVDTPEIEVLIVPGGNFPTMPWIAAWERALGKPVITTNQATLWGALGVMNLNNPMPGLGRLLQQMPR
ncbi:MAG: maleate isomerase [Acetobacteraceae bacterium]|jgi:maleate isomerase|nr:maleate isomerase [Acetobacteraceae bacterium]